MREDSNKVTHLPGESNVVWILKGIYQDLEFISLEIGQISCRVHTNQRDFIASIYWTQKDYLNSHVNAVSNETHLHQSMFPQFTMCC